MVQLELTAGKKKEIFPVNSFPCNIGRGSKNNVRLKSRGVWDEHASLVFQQEHGFSIITQSHGSLIVNGDSCDRARLKNGDTIELGSARLRFWLAPIQAPSSENTDLLFWSVIAMTIATMLGLMLFLPH
ncbi:MAG: hypothetical protein CMO80_17305 [Verrucomicrobiales bacterium]|nr:hypothetical protein [Verrucomicrobiales bacterium]|tara:strand:- start:14874 stop:15260 length:387 start_codon:yes stop_codon:yes gene_type:complete